MSEVTTTQNGALMSFIERAAKDESFDVAKFETLLRVRRDEAHDYARRVFNQAMAICQHEMEPVLRSTPNKGVGGRYAKLEDIDQQMRPIYTSHGFSVRFGSAPPPQPGWLRITCTVAHESGYFEENYLDSPVSNQGAQGGRMAMTPVQAVGSVVTYLRRYLLGMVFNIVQADVVGEDDDGEAMRRAAPAPMRAERKVDPTPYEAPAKSTPRPRTRREFLDGLSIALRDAQSAEEVDRIVCGEEVMRAKEVFQNGHKAELDKLIADALAKWWTEPTEEELPEVEIEGQDKVMAGD
jgi:hypothetical protein